MSVIEKQTGPAEAVAIAVRVLAASLGAWAVAYCLAAALTGAFARLGAGRADAVMLGSVLALFAFPAISIWSFAERRLWVVAAAPALGAALLALGATLVRP